MGMGFKFEQHRLGLWDLSWDQKKTIYWEMGLGPPTPPPPIHDPLSAVAIRSFDKHELYCLKRLQRCIFWNAEPFRNFSSPLFHTNQLIWGMNTVWTTTRQVSVKSELTSTLCRPIYHYGLPHVHLLLKQWNVSFLSPFTSFCCYG